MYSLSFSTIAHDVENIYVDCFTYSPHYEIGQGDINGNVRTLNRSRQPTQFSRCLNFKPTERYVFREDHARAESQNGDHLIAATLLSRTEKVKWSEDENRYSHFTALVSSPVCTSARNRSSKEM